MSRFRTRKHPTQSLGAGELNSNHLPRQIRYPKETVRDEVDTVSDFTAAGRRVVISAPGHPRGRAAGTRRYGGRRF
jgi:hypothetical protein